MPRRGASLTQRLGGGDDETQSLGHREVAPYTPRPEPAAPPPAPAPPAPVPAAAMPGPSYMVSEVPSFPDSAGDSSSAAGQGETSGEAGDAPSDGGPSGDGNGGPSGDGGDGGAGGAGGGDAGDYDRGGYVGTAGDVRPGEYVIRASQTAKHMNLLHAINSGRVRYQAAKPGNPRA